MRQRFASPIDFGLYLVTDRNLSLGRPLEAVVEAAVRGGVLAVQLREKSAAQQEFVSMARRLLALLRPRQIPLIINDRVDAALESGADGVHLGQSDMPVEEARKMLGPDAIIGLSIETLDEALRAENLDVDYLGVSPIFQTPTKTDTKTPWGLDGLRALRSFSRHLLIAIGGVNAVNALAVLEAGADGLAVVSAICSAPDPESAARELRAIVDGYRQGKKNIRQKKRIR
jgi:thiamine-phosphate pyrophosphorylase